MIPTIPYIESKFKHFNDLMFEGKLSPIPVELSNAKTFIGLLAFKKRRKFLGKVEYYDFKLRINTRVDLPESEVEDTIIHEMIHYYIYSNHLKDTSAHGVLFKAIMSKINNEYGRNITITHKSSAEQREQLKDNRKRWHVIAVVNFHDGQAGIKVLPRIVSRITNYYNNVIINPKIASIELYMHNDPYFNQFPTSSAFTVRFDEPSNFRPHLVNAKVMIYENGVLRYKH